MDYTAYYTFEIKVRSWRDRLRVVKSTWDFSSRRSKLFAPFIFLIVWIGKLFITVHPSEGFLCPMVLPIVEANELPEGAYQDLLPIIQQFENEGLRLTFFFSSTRIGTIKKCSALLLDPTGTFWANIYWIKVQSLPAPKTSKVFSETIIVYGCSSRFADGVNLSTAAIGDSFPNQTIDRPKHISNIIPKTSTPQETIQVHREQIAKYGSPANQYDLESLQAMLLDYLQDDFHYRVTKGEYRPLTPAEVEHILNEERELSSHTSSQN